MTENISGRYCASNEVFRIRLAYAERQRRHKSNEDHPGQRQLRKRNNSLERILTERFRYVLLDQFGAAGLTIDKRHAAALQTLLPLTHTHHA